MVKTHRAHAARAGRPTSPSTSSMAKLWRQSGAFVICKQRKRAMPTDDAATPSGSQAETTASSTDAAAASRRANLRRAGRGMRRATTFFQPVVGAAVQLHRPQVAQRAAAHGGSQQHTTVASSEEALSQLLELGFEHGSNLNWLSCKTDSDRAACAKMLEVCGGDAASAAQLLAFASRQQRQSVRPGRGMRRCTTFFQPTGEMPRAVTFAGLAVLSASA